MGKVGANTEEQREERRSENELKSTIILTKEAAIPQPYL